MKVDMELLKKLRNATFAPLKDCKDALVEAEGDFSRAQDILKEKGILKAAKKADRDTNDGLVLVKQDGNVTFGIKMGCETDFVAKNDLFLSLMEEVSGLVKSYNKPFRSLAEMDSNYLETVITPVIAAGIGSIGENIKLVDAFYIEGNTYVYTHPGSKVATVVVYEGNDDGAVSKELALQITAMSPLYMSVETVPQSMKDELKAEFIEDMKDSGKPAEMIEKIVEGKVMKKYNEIVLLEQGSIRDESKKVKHIIPAGYSLVDYIRFSI
ncbi:MAG: translation elongation factor Ts [Candidatus Absconditabacteria bacterium]